MITIDALVFGYLYRKGDSLAVDRHDRFGGVSVYIDFRNKGTKTIKYATFELYPVNAVGDKVTCDISHECTKRLTHTGPLEPGHIVYGTNSYWESVWYNYQVSKVVITKIFIEYMDGTTEEQEPIMTPKEELKRGCYVATCVYGSYDCPEVWTLRRFRDYTLAQSFLGRSFIKFYYAISPTLVKRFGKTTWFKKMWETPLNALVSILQKKGVSSEAYVDIKW